MRLDLATLGELLDRFAPTSPFGSHHLHLAPVGSKRYIDELAFRDRLRARPADRRGIPRTEAESRESFRE